uniref:Fibronectin type-III domain-containing protein n=1 Tax=viral metagenome TaxID=1070528 RepID=A0A6C0EWA2_9ZZZZ
MAHAFSPIPAKPTFGNITQSDYASDYIQNKIAKLAYCRDLKKSNCKKKFSQSELLLFNKGRLLNSYAFGIGTSLINESNLIAGLYTQSDLSGVAVICDVSGDACITPTAIDSSNVPFYEHYLIDPDGQLFGNTPCGITNFTKYMTLPSISSILGPPIELDASGGLRSVTLSWNSPMTNDNNIPITDYIIYYSSDNAAAYDGYDGWTIINISSGNASTSMYPVSGLLNGTTYYFKVEAVGSLAEGGKVAFSEVVSATTTAVASLPSKPTNTYLDALDSSIRLTWTAPADDGGSPITGYIIYYKSSDVDISSKASTNDINWISHSTYSVDGISTTATITGLTNGTTYYFRLYSQNVVGVSINYDRTGGFYPYTIPDSPTIVNGTTSDQSVLLEWSPPSRDGGAAISNYTIYYTDNTIQSPKFSEGVSGPNTSYNITELTNGHTYNFTISANNIGGSSIPSDGITITLANIPDPPTNLTAVPSGDSVLLSWTPPSNNNGVSYIINYTTDTSFTSGIISIQTSNTSMNILSLIPNTTYYFRVYSENSIYMNIYRFPQTYTKTFSIPPGSPTIDLSLNSYTGDTQVHVSWDPHINTGGSAITSYIIQYSTDSTLTTDVSGIDISNNASSPIYSTNISGLTPYTTYYFKIASVNILGTGAYSTPTAITTLMTAPTSLHSNSTNNSSVNLSWKSPNNNIGISDYSVQYSTDNSNWSIFIHDPIVSIYIHGYIIFGSVIGSYYSASVNVTGLSSNTQYYFRVAAVSTNNVTGVYCIDISASTLPATPTNLTAVPSDSSIMLSWNSPAISSDIYYGINYSTDETFLNGVIDSSSNDTSKNITGLINGTLYYFRVSSINGLYDTSSSFVDVFATPMATITYPDPPTDLNGGWNYDPFNPSNSELSIYWTASPSTPSSNIQYYIHYTTDATQPGFYENSITTSSTSCSISDVSSADNIIVNVYSQYKDTLIKSSTSTSYTFSPAPI